MESSEPPDWEKNKVSQVTPKSTSFRQAKTNAALSDLRKFKNLVAWLNPKGLSNACSGPLTARHVFDLNETSVLPVLQQLHSLITQSGRIASSNKDGESSWSKRNGERGERGENGEGGESRSGPSTGKKEQQVGQVELELTESGVPAKAWVFWKNDGSRYFSEAVWATVDTLDDAVERYITGCSSLVRNVSRKTLNNSFRYLLLVTRLLCTLQFASEAQLQLVETAVQETQRLTTTEMVNSSFMPVTDPLELFRLRNLIAERLCRMQKEEIDPFLAVFFSGLNGGGAAAVQSFCFHKLQPFIEMGMRIWGVPTRIQVTQNLLLPSAHSKNRAFVSKLVATASGFRVVIWNDKIATGKEHTSLVVPSTLSQYLLFLIQHGRANPESPYVFQSKKGGFWKHASRDVRQFVHSLGVDTDNVFRHSMFVHGTRNMGIATFAVMCKFDLHKLNNLAHLMRHQMATLQHVYSPWLSMRIGESANSEFHQTFGTPPLESEMQARQEAEEQVRRSCVRLPLCTEPHLRHRLNQDMLKYYLQLHGADPAQKANAGRFFAFGVKEVACQTESSSFSGLQPNPPAPIDGCFSAKTEKMAVETPSLDKTAVDDDLRSGAVKRPVDWTAADGGQHLEGSPKRARLLSVGKEQGADASTVSVKVPVVPHCRTCGLQMVLFGPHGTKREAKWYGRMYLHCNSGRCSTMARPSRSGSLFFELGHVPVGAVTQSQRPRNLPEIEAYVRSQLPASRQSETVFQDSLFKYQTAQNKTKPPPKNQPKETEKVRETEKLRETGTKTETKTETDSVRD